MERKTSPRTNFNQRALDIVLAIDRVRDAVDMEPVHGMRFKGIDGPVTVYDVLSA